jgi:hypothetical protein
LIPITARAEGVERIVADHQVRAERLGEQQSEREQQAAAQEGEQDPARGER